MKKDKAQKKEKVYPPPRTKIILPGLASLAVAIVLLLLPPAHTARAAELSVPEVAINGGDVLVTDHLTLEDNLVKEIKGGVEKRLIIHVDLFKVWNNWADEFILGKKIERDISCDNVKKEYTMREDEDGNFKDLRFGSCEELLKSALTVKALKLASDGEIRAAPYYVKVTAESRLRNMPPLVGIMLFFIKEKEFSIERDSPEMRLGR